MKPKGKRALVIGFGRSGRAAAAYIRAQGGMVKVVDRADTPELRTSLQNEGLEHRLGGYSETDLRDADLVIVSPGVPWDLPLLESARKQGLPVTSEIDLFFRACPSPIAGITGTNGKTTTTALTAEVLRAGGLRVMRGGNIGEPVLDRVDQLGADDWVVLELSSFQLESIEHPRLRIGTVLNVTPDHLDRHRSMERYAEIKTRAVSFMEPDDHAVLNFDDPTVRAMSLRTRGQLMSFSTAGSVADAGVTVQSGWIVIRARDDDRRIMPVDKVPLPGAHNLSNVLAAVGAGASAGVTGERMAQAVREFKGVEHRLELIGTFRGVRWYNDSKATNPDSTYKALDAFTEPLILIAGGRNKGLDVAPLAKAIARRATALIAIGETADELVQLARKEGLSASVLATDLADAVRRAAATATPGSVVLLSPGFTSFDMFRDYEDRGRRFKAAVMAEVGA